MTTKSHTETADAKLFHELTEAARHEEMIGNVCAAAGLRRQASDVESLDPIYEQTRDAAAVRAKARKSLATIAARAGKAQS